MSSSPSWRGGEESLFVIGGGAFLGLTGLSSVVRSIVSPRGGDDIGSWYVIAGTCQHYA